MFSRVRSSLLSGTWSDVSFVDVRERERAREPESERVRERESERVRELESERARERES